MQIKNSTSNSFIIRMYPGYGRMLPDLPLMSPNRGSVPYWHLTNVFLFNYQKVKTKFLLFIISLLLFKVLLLQDILFIFIPNVFLRERTNRSYVIMDGETIAFLLAIFNSGALLFMAVYYVSFSYGYAFHFSILNYKDIQYMLKVWVILRCRAQLSISSINEEVMQLFSPKCDFHYQVIWSFA